MENLFIKRDVNIKKPVIGKYSFMGGSFYVALIPEKLSFFTKRRLKKQLRRFEGTTSYTSGIYAPYINQTQTDGSLCMTENIEMLCRKICKNSGISMPPSVALYDSVFTSAGAEVLNRLGRMCSEMYVVTKSKIAHQYAEYMLEEYGCVVCVTENTVEADIIIAAQTLFETPQGVIIDLFGMNTEKTCISRLFFEYKNIGKEDLRLFGGVCDSRMYDFLYLSGAKINQNINFIGYG